VTNVNSSCATPPTSATADQAQDDAPAVQQTDSSQVVFKKDETDSESILLEERRLMQTMTISRRVHEAFQFKLKDVYKRGVGADVR